MSDSTDAGDCHGDCHGGAGIPEPSPFYAPRYHFGMLLGVDDFETEQAYHRGKSRLHNAWLHGAGTAWGWEVTLGQPTTAPTAVPAGILHVGPGLALDGAGRELHLGEPACLSIADWYERHRAELPPPDDVDRPVFDAHIVARFRACPTHPVPAIRETCQSGGEGTGVAAARVLETAELLLRPGKSPPPPPTPFPRLRMLFGIDPPTSLGAADVLSAWEQVADAPPDQRSAAWLTVLRRCARLDALARRPASSDEGTAIGWFPELETCVVVLADLVKVSLVKSATGWQLNGGDVDYSPRSTLLPTTQIQDLLVGGRALQDSASASGGATGAPGVVASELPWIEPTGVVVDEREITLQFDRRLHRGSVGAAAFSVTSLGAGSGAKWRRSAIRAVKYEESSGVGRVTLKLSQPLPAGTLVRLVAHGTGPTPLLDSTLRPLIGVRGPAAATQQDGSDFVFMTQRN